MTFRNMAAYTAPGANYPEYMNVSEDMSDGKIRIVVRSPVNKDGKCGDTAQITISKEEFKRIFYEALGNISDSEDYFA